MLLLNSQAKFYGLLSPSLGDAVSVSWPRGEGLQRKVRTQRLESIYTGTQTSVLITAAL